MAMTVGTKGWFSHTGARTASKIRQSGASQFETTKRKAHWGKKKKPAGGKSPEDTQTRQRSQLDGMTWGHRWGGRKPLNQHSRRMSLHVPCTTPSSNFWGLEVCYFCDIFPPKEDTKVETLERWDHRNGAFTRGGAGWEPERPSCSARLPPGLAESYKRL